jgi:hypothetical protein
VTDSDGEYLAVACWVLLAMLAVGGCGPSSSDFAAYLEGVADSVDCHSVAIDAVTDGGPIPNIVDCVVGKARARGYDWPERKP